LPIDHIVATLDAHMRWLLSFSLLALLVACTEIETINPVRTNTLIEDPEAYPTSTSSGNCPGGTGTPSRSWSCYPTYGKSLQAEARLDNDVLRLRMLGHHLTAQRYVTVMFDTDGDGAGEAIMNSVVDSNGDFEASWQVATCAAHLERAQAFTTSCELKQAQP
jgi:hypothetical protein